MIAKRMKITVLLALLYLLVMPVSAKVIRVTPSTTHLICSAEAGDVVVLTKGRYSKPIELDALCGLPARPVIIRAEKGVVFDGTDMLDGKWMEVTPHTKEGRMIQSAQWKRMKGKLYCRQLEEPVYALIYNGRFMNNARWPDSGWDDPWRQDRYYVLRRADVGSTKGRLQDGLPTENALEESSTWLHYDRDQCYQRKEMLGETELSFQNAVMVLSHTWGSWATRVTHHRAGDDFIEYDTTFEGSGSLRQQADAFLNKRIDWNKTSKFKRSAHAGIHYFLMGLPALDRPGEWWYDAESKLLFFISPDGRMPEKGTVQGKRRDYALTMHACNNIGVQGIEFYGAALSMTNCSGCRIEDCNFKFSASEKFSIGNFDQPVTVNITNGKKFQHLEHNALVNCQFSYLDGNAFEAKSPGMVIDNVLIYRTQQTTLGLTSHSMMLQQPSLVRRMTIDDVGASTGIRGGGSRAIYELNNIMRFGGLQYDGSAIQTGGRDTVIYRYNWSHDHPKRSFRFDSGAYPRTANAYGEMSYNVAWNTPAGFSLKGDDHLIHNNLCIDAGFVLFNMKRWASKNERTLVANNIVGFLSAGTDDWKAHGVRKNNRNGAAEQVKEYWLKETVVADDAPTFYGKVRDTFDDGTRKKSAKASPLLSILKNNSFELAEELVRDPQNLDFRLKKGSSLIRAGYLITNKDVSWKDVPVTGSETWKGNPSVGPYEPDEAHYWIPGFQHPHASTPVPVDGTSTAKADCDLMWLEGYKAIGHVVYFSTSEGDLMGDKPSSAYQIAQFSGDANIVYLNKAGIKLKPKHTYYWRVDALMPEGRVKGKIWKFTVEG